MNTTVKRIIASLGGLLLIAYLIYHTFVVPYESIKTEQTVAFTARDTVTSNETFIIRSERVVSSSASGSYRYNVGNGDRVANGGEVANVYSSASAVETLSKIDDIDRQLDNLKSLNNISGGTVIDISQINNQIEERFIETLSSVDNGDFSQVSDAAQGYLTAVNRRLAATGNNTDFSQVIASLEAEKASLKSSVGIPTVSISAPCAGYFISTVDGYENAVSPDGISTLTPEIFDQIKPGEIDKNAVGKVVSDVNWYIAVKVGFDQSLQFSVGDSLKLEISASSIVSVPAKIVSINKGNAAGSAVIVFSSSYMNADISSLRSPSVRIIINTFEGLKVSTAAIKVKDGKKGVYVSNGSSMTFVPIKQLYSGNGYVVCKREDPMKNGLHIYDDVIVKGKNLYDGKSIN